MSPMEKSDVLTPTNNYMRYCLMILMAGIGCCSLRAQIVLPSLIRDSMILQRQMPVKIWGRASPGEKIVLHFATRRYQARATEQGNWEILLPPTPAGGPYDIEIRGRNRVVLKDVLFGDVFLCSGQSNMVHSLNLHDITYASDIANANDPDIRQFLVPVLPALTGPQTDYPQGQWTAATADNVRSFSAVAYFFAKAIHDRYQIPVGIINASVGGSPIRAWMSPAALPSFPALQSAYQKNQDTAAVFTHNRAAAQEAAGHPLPPDSGMAGPVKWFDPLYSPQGWKSIRVPGYWEDQGIADLNGTVWYRKEMVVPDKMANAPALLHLGRIVDADELYINGQLLGRTTYQYPQRRYRLPKGALKPGTNTVTIRVTNYSGKGGFVPDKPYYLVVGNDSIDLSGVWHYRVGSAFPPTTASAEPISLIHQPAALFNGMLAPATPYAIKGICWYQGESDTGTPAEYARQQKALISDWRTQWKSDSLPFLFVQLPGFVEYRYLPGESQWALFREAQATALQLPHTAMAVAIDLGEWNDIHPDNKKDVGARLSRAAFATIYGENLPHTGPRFQQLERRNDSLVVHFSNAEGGLRTSDGQPVGSIAIAGADGHFLWAHTRIEGNRLIAWNPQIAQPVYLRYAWADNPTRANLTDGHGLPAAPFRTDTLKSMP